MLLVSAHSIYNQPKLQGSTTELRGIIYARPPNYLDIHLTIWNHRDTDTNYNWIITLYHGDKNNTYPFSNRAKAHNGLKYVTTIILSPHEKENPAVGIEVYEEGELIEERIFYLDYNRLPITW